MENDKLQRNFYLSRLIIEELSGKISDERRRELKDWLKSTETNEEMYKGLKEELAQTIAHPLPDIDSNEGWNAFYKKQLSRHKRKVHPLLRKWSVAAAVAIVLGTGLFYFFHPHRTDRPTQEEAQLVVPGTARARLILAEGEIVDLKSPQKKALDLGNGISIRLDSGKVTYQRQSGKNDPQSTSYNTLVIPRGGEYALQLSDGTRVWLNAATTLKYPPVFSGKQRLVELDGEAYFEVARDTALPFIVRTASLDVQVYGTSFDVCAYQEDEQQYTTLLSGSVGVRWKEKEVFLNSGEQAVLDVQEGKMEVKPVQAHLYCSWHTGTFVFEEKTLGEILERLSRWYDVEVTYRTPEVKELHFTGDLNRYDDFGKILKFLEMTNKVKFVVQGKTVIVDKK